MKCNYRHNMWCNCKTPIKKYTITIESNNTDYGTIDVDEKEVGINCEISANGNQLTIGGTTITATPKVDTSEYDYEFEGWYVNGTKIVEPIYVEGEMTIEANFTRVLQPYTVTFYGDGGEVLQTSRYSYGDTPVYSGATPTKQSTVQYEYVFAGWNPAIHTVEGDQEYTAIFTPVVRTYVVNFTNDGNGSTNYSSINRDYGSSITISGDTITIADVTVTATASQGYEFDAWVNVDGGDIPATLTANLNIRATFRPAGYTITFEVSSSSYSQGGGTFSQQSIVVPVGTTVETNDPMHERHGSSLIFKNNGQTIATVNAIPNSGFMFEYWSTGSYYDEGYELCEDLEFIGTFIPTITVTFVINPVGGGTVTQQSIVVPEGSYAGVNYGNENHLIIDSNCYVYNEVIATASQGYSFSSWSASGTIIDHEHSFYLGDEDITITANFAQPYTITFQPYMEQDGSGDLIGDGGGTCSPSSVEVSSGAHATTSGNTMTIIDPIYGNTTVTFTIAQDTAQYEYFDPEFHYYVYEGEYGQETDYTYESLTEGSGIDRDGTVGVRLYRRTKSYDVYVSEASSSGSGSESYSQRDDPYKYYGTTWTVNGNTITFSDGSSVTATPNTGSYFGGWYTDYEGESPLSASGAVTGEMSIYAQYGETHTITFQPYMVDHDTGTFIEDGGGTCSPSSVIVTKDARATVNGNTMTVTDPVFGNTNVVFTIAQDTAQYEYEFNDFREYDDPDYGPDSTYYYLVEGGEGGISSDGTVGVEVIRTEITYEFSVSTEPGGIVTPDGHYDEYLPYGTTWTVNGNTITLSNGDVITVTAEPGYSFSRFVDPSTGNTLASSGTITEPFGCYAEITQI